MSQSLPENEPEEISSKTQRVVGPSCWRCGLEVPAGVESCPHCAARIITHLSPFAFVPRKSLSNGFGLLFVTYGLLLVTGLVHAIVLNFTAEPRKGFDKQVRANAFTQILVVEAIDTVLVSAALFSWRGQGLRPLPAQGTRITAWIVSVPLLAGILLIDFGYHELIREIIHVPLMSDRLMQHFDLIAIVAICLQPAIVEEAYCRWFALDCFRGPLGEHAAVWISAIMFGFLHVAVLPSVPYLILLGGFLAYMRLASGTLLLPMLLHFVHNFVILLIRGA